VIDQWFAKTKGDQWIRSERRSSLFDEKVRNKLSQHEADTLVSWLDEALQVGALDHKLLHGLMEKMIWNDAIPVTTRRHCLFLVGRAYKKSVNKNELLSLLTGCVTGANNAEIRRAAAQSIRNCIVPLK
jgi:hypothetical protein